MKSQAAFSSFYASALNAEGLEYEFDDWNRDVPVCAVPTVAHSSVNLCSVDIATGAITDIKGEYIITMNDVAGDSPEAVDIAYSRIVSVLFSVEFDLSSFLAAVDNLALTIARSVIDLSDCVVTIRREWRPKRLGPCDLWVVRKSDNAAARLTFRKRGIWQIDNYATTVVIDPFGAISPHDAARMIRFTPGEQA